MGNWQARLAATAIGLAQKHRVLILLPDVCWKCVKDQIDKFPTPSVMNEDGETKYMDYTLIA